MAKGLSVATAFMAIIGIAPWAVYVGGLAKLTDVLTNWELAEAAKQTVVMLEWYIVSSQLVNLFIIIVLGFTGRLHRAHSLLNMFLAVASTLMILQATLRVQQITALDKDGWVNTSLPDSFLTLLLKLDSNPLPYLRALACGQIASATWNFFLAILISFAGTEQRPEPQEPYVKGATAA